MQSAAAAAWALTSVLVTTCRRAQAHRPLHALRRPLAFSPFSASAAQPPPRLTIPIQGAGCAVIVSVEDPDTPVTVTTGRPDAVEAWWEGAAGQAAGAHPLDWARGVPRRKDSTLFKGAARPTPPGSDVSITAPAGARSANPHAAHLRLAIPARYAGLDVTTAGGAVSVDGVTEAGLRIVSGGGRVTLGDIRATDACVGTCGGPLTARVRSGEHVEVLTHGGNARIDRLVARVGTVDTTDPGVADGCLVVSAALGDVLALSSGTAPLAVGTLHAQVGAAVTTTSGGIGLEGVDGSAHVAVEEPGGVVGIHLLAGATGVRVSAPGGAIAAALDPSLMAGGRDLQCGGEDEDEGEEDALVLLGDPLPGGAGLAADAANLVARAVAAEAVLRARWGWDPRKQAEERGEEEGPLILLDARPGGSVAVRAATWFDGVKERVGKPVE